VSRTGAGSGGGSSLSGVITMSDTDDRFYDRADEHIHLSNSQMRETEAGKVSASMMYATARFNSWLTARGFSSGDEMQKLRDQSIEYFITEYRKMLEENMDDYINNFEKYTGNPGDGA
jgi:hypothetical protein